MVNNDGNSVLVKILGKKKKKPGIINKKGGYMKFVEETGNKQSKARNKEIKYKVKVFHLWEI
jgi:hypothetical protein